MIHTLRLDNYSPTPRKLVLGTNSSFGTESIQIERGAGWDGLALTATWHIPGREEPLRVALLDGDAMDVPPEVTKEARDGVLVLAGLAEGVQRASCNVEYLILEQAGVYGGQDAEPTPELAAQVLEAALQAKADAEAAAQEAAEAKARAEEAQAASAAAQEAAEAAAADAAKAGPYAEAALAAQQAAEDARDKATAAQQAAENAAAAAAASKSAADTLAAEAARAALAAEESKAAANAAANLAGENATAAQQAAGVTIAAANDAGQSASDAAASKAAAETAAKAAQEAQAAAAAAKADAVKAQTAAQAAAKTAQDAQSAAEKARDDAQTARQGAESARDAAAGSAEAAAKSEANAKQSADTLAESVENVAANTAAVAELREKKAEIDDTAVGADGWSSKHIVDMLCPKIEESGNPVQCYPVAGYPLGVTASWEPVQEGKGEPYPAGGGKNLLNFPENTVLKGTGDTELEFPFDLNGDYVFSFKGNVKVVEIGSALWMFEIDGVQKYIVADSGMESLALSGHITKVALTNWGKCTGTIIWAQLEKGSTPTAYAPYENIRPIKGRDSVTVERCGENVIELVSPYGNNSDVTIAVDEQVAITINGTTIEKSNINIMKCRLHWKAGEKYTMFVKKLGGSCKIGDGTGITFAYSLFTEDYNKFFRGDTGATSMDRYTATSEALNETELIFMLQCWRPGTVFNNFKIQIAVVRGTVAPENYEPYTGQTNTLTLPETTYGGSVDAVSGRGERARRMLSLDGTENWFTWGVNANNAAVTGFFTYDIADYKVENEKGICSHLPHPSGDTWGGRNEGIGFTSVGSSRYLMCCVKTKILDDVSSDAIAITSWKAYLAAQYAAGTPVQVCYKLATPVPFTATGGAALPALAGVNTVLTDADSVEVTGRADPIKRIEDLEAAVASIN